MLIERDGYFYVPIETFARLSGVDKWRVIASISNGIIHHSYVYRWQSYEQAYKWRISLRQDKAEAYGQFMRKYKTTTEIAQMCRKKFGMVIDGHKFTEMVGQGYLPNEWCIFVYPNQDSRVVYLLADKVQEIAETYKTYIAEEEKREHKGIRIGERTIEYPQPKNAKLYRPNPECLGFILAPEQIEIVKLFRKYRENREPLF